MPVQLTYADRDALLGVLGQSEAASGLENEEILEAVGEWVKQLTPTFGFELSLTRDVAALSRYLTTHRDDSDIADIARGALLNCLQSNKLSFPPIEEFRLLNVSFLCGYAVHEIRTHLGEPATYSPPKLTKNEQKQAETLFLRGLEDPCLQDGALIEKSRSIARGLGNLSICGLFWRLNKNIEFLVHVLEDDSRNADDKSYARGALNYLVVDEDAIEDHLGIVGYLDDDFIARLAVDLIEPDREPWLDFLDVIVGGWPFLNGLLIDDGSGGRPVSEFMMINSSLACNGLKQEDFPSSVALILPEIGPVSFLLGFISALGLIHEADKHEFTEESFRSGQKVIVDGCAIREFTGFREVAGERRFGLKKYITRRGHSEPCTRYWPMTYLDRLVPAESSRATRGRLDYDLEQSSLPLPAVDYLFSIGTAGQILGIQQRLIVVMPVVDAHEMAKRFSLHGHALKDVIPMGHVTSEQQINRWSNRFGEQEPLLIFVSDLDVACEFAENDPNCTSLVIVEASGRNEKKNASLQRLKHFEIPTLVVSTERAAEGATLTEGDNVGIWEWTGQDFPALLWPAHAAEYPRGRVVKYEKRLLAQAKTVPELISIPLPLAEQAFDDVRYLRSLARLRGEAPLLDLDRVVGLALSVLSRLLRTASPFGTGFEAEGSVESCLEELMETRKQSIYMSDEEQASAIKAEESLLSLFCELQRNNPKEEILRGILGAHPTLAIVCPDARLRPDLEQAYSGFGTRIVAGISEEEALMGGAILIGWFRKDSVAKLLVPPVTDPLYLILYDIEKKWYDDFQRARMKARESRLEHGHRSRLFPKVEGWRKPEIREKQDEIPSQESRLHELETIQEHVRTAYRRSLTQRAEVDGSDTEAEGYLVVFEGDWYGFLTESFQANVVTHLMETIEEGTAEKADIRQKPLRELRPGDALLFHLGSDSDVIRTAADKILPHGRRETASIWRYALERYMSQNGIGYEDLWKQLSQAGCPLQFPTVKNWLMNRNMIGPRESRRDVEIIAKVTGDEILLQRMEEVLDSISEVRSAHRKAGNAIAKSVLANALGILRKERDESALVEIEPNVVVVRAVEIDDKPTVIRASWTNRLLEGEHWHE